MFKLVVLSVVVALAAAEPGIIAPVWGGLAAPWAAAPLAVGVVGLGAPNYRGPLSLAPGQPASIIAADGRPLDTLDVNVDRAVHLTAKALNNVHLLKKRSVVAPWAASVAAPLAWPSAGVVAPAGIVGPSGIVGPAGVVGSAGIVGPTGVVVAARVGGLGWPAARVGHLW